MSVMKSKLYRLAMVSMSIVVVPLHVVWALSSSELWDEYAANPDHHSNIPNCSYAGYRYGEVDPPHLPVVVTLTDFGGVGDGSTDNSLAFWKAQKAAFERGGGAVFIPEGTYVVENMITLVHSGVVFRGAGMDKTIIKFTRDLENVAGSTGYGTSQWNWTGGLLWISGKQRFKNFDDKPWATSRTGTGEDAMGHAWEYWRMSGAIADIVGEYDRGERTLTVSDASLLQDNQKIILAYEVPGDTSLMKTIGEHESMQNWNGYGSWLPIPRVTGHFRWAVEIESVQGNTITLVQPLRVPIKNAFNVSVRYIGDIVQEAGVEELTLLLDAPSTMSNNGSSGYNGVNFDRAWNCWARNVTVRNGQNGFLVTSSKNVSLLNTSVVGDRMVHHPYTARCFTQDVLWDGFTVDLSGEVLGGMHGINTEYLSAGNVWTRGTMQQGTFDSHRAMSFDYLRTEIFVKNNEEANPGGAKQAGPYTGARTVHWNIEVGENAYEGDEKGLYVYQPDCHVLGAHVGIRGLNQLCDNCCWNNCGSVMPEGEKGNINIEMGQVPNPVNLYDAQIALREQSQPWVHITSHLNGMLVEGDKEHTITVDQGSRTGSVSLFVNNEKFASKSGSSPLTFTLPTEKSQAYVLVAKLDGTDVESAPVTLSTGGFERWSMDHDSVSLNGNWDNTSKNPETFFFDNGKNTYDEDASFEIRFKGTRLDVVCNMWEPKIFQDYDVYIDGQLVYKDFPVAYNAHMGIASEITVWSTGVLNPGHHTIKLQQKTKNGNLKYNYLRVFTSESEIPVLAAAPGSRGGEAVVQTPVFSVKANKLLIGNAMPGTLSLFSMQGRILATYQLDGATAGNAIDLGGVAKGAVIARFNGKKIHKTMKIMGVE